MKTSQRLQGLALIGLAGVAGLWLTGCNDRHSLATPPATPAPVPAPAPSPAPAPVPVAKTKVVLKGRIVDEPIPNAGVVATSGSSTFTTVADAQGNYTLPVELPTSAADTPLILTATGTGTQGNVKLVSLPGSLASLASDAGSDGVLTADENIRSNVTHVSTAEAVLVMELGGGSLPATQAQQEALVKQVDPAKLFDIAATIKLIVDTAEYNLPSGFTDTLAFAQASSARDTYIAETVQPEDLEEAKQQTAASPDAVPQMAASDVPAELLAISAENDSRFAPEGEFSVGYSFAQDGTGRAFDSASNEAINWNFGNNAINVSYPNAQTFDGAENFDSDGDGQIDSQLFVRYTTLSQSITKLSDSIVSIATTTRVEYPNREKADRTDVDTAATLVLDGPEDFRSFLPAGFATQGGRFLMQIFYAPGLSNGKYASDVLTFNANGTGSEQYFGRSFTWTIASDGSLNVTQADGSRLRYRGLAIDFTNQDLLTTKVFLDVQSSGQKFIGTTLVVQPAETLRFDATTAAGEYYLRGFGTYDNGRGEGFDGRLKGFRQKLMADGTSYQGQDFFASDGSVQDQTFENNGGQGFGRWTVGPDGMLTIRRYYDSTAQNPGSPQSRSCNPASNANCKTFDIREIIPFTRLGDRFYWIETRRLNGPGNEVSLTMPPQTVLYRLYDKATAEYALVGSWEFVEPQGSAQHRVVVTFKSDGSYLMGTNDDEASCKSDNGGASDANIEAGGNGWEKGGYRWNPATGLLSLSNVTETNGTCGFSEGGRASFDDREYLIPQADGTLALRCQGEDGSFEADCEGQRLRRVPRVERVLNGSWDITDSGESGNPEEHIYFFADGRYFYVNATTDDDDSPECTNGGIERGSFAFDATSGRLDFSNFLVDTDGRECGPSSVDADTPLILRAPSERIRDFEDEDGDVVRFRRIAP